MKNLARMNIHDHRQLPQMFDSEIFCCSIDFSGDQGEEGKARARKRHCRCINRLHGPVIRYIFCVIIFT